MGGKIIKLRELKAKKDLSSSEYDVAFRILEAEDHEENCGKCKEGMVHKPVIKDADGNIECSVVRPENGMYDGFPAIRIYTTPGEQLNEKQKSNFILAIRAGRDLQEATKRITADQEVPTIPALTRWVSERRYGS